MSIVIEVDQAATTTGTATGIASRTIAGATHGMGRGLAIGTASSTTVQALTLTAAKAGAVGAVVGGGIVAATNCYKTATGCMTPNQAATDTAIQTSGFGLSTALAIGTFSAAAGIGAALGSTLVVPLVASTFVGTLAKKFWDLLWYPVNCPGKETSAGRMNKN